MEAVNKKHSEITSNQRVDLAAFFRVRDRKSLYFSAKACIDFGLTPGRFIHFYNDEARWYFYVSEDTDGFKLIGRTGKNAALICDASLVKLITKRAKIPVGVNYLVTPTKAQLSVNKLLEINFDKPIEKEV